MLQIIIAPPRSGKSYYFVNYLLKFCTFDPLYNEYVLAPNVLIISNVEGLRVKHWNLADCLKKIPFKEFFSIANFEAIQQKTGKNHIILGIDESHEYFPKGYSDTAVYSFFAYHGHIGLDVFFMTQGVEEFTRSFNPLFELRVVVTPRSKSIPSLFKYDFQTKEGKYLYSKSLQKNKLVFGAYQSFRKDELNKPKNALVMWALMTVLILGGSFGIFKLAIGTVHAKSEAAAAKAAAAAASAPVPAAVSPSVTLSPVASAAVIPSAPVLPPPDSRAVKMWRVYTSEGFLDFNGRRGYLIHGKSVPAPLCRNYDPVNKSIEYFGGEIFPEDGGVRSPPDSGEISGHFPELGNEADPLGEAEPSLDLSLLPPPADRNLSVNEKLEKFIAN